ncbi:MAG: hypothetical protein ABL898_07420 [Hyphomicrobiaceae bacterium]
MNAEQRSSSELRGRYFLATSVGMVKSILTFDGATAITAAPMKASKAKPAKTAFLIAELITTARLSFG